MSHRNKYESNNIVCDQSHQCALELANSLQKTLQTIRKGAVNLHLRLPQFRIYLVAYTKHQTSMFLVYSTEHLILLQTMSIKTMNLHFWCVEKVQIVST